MVSPSEIPPAPLLGGKIRLLQRIGRGGMGDVWIARNEATQAEVAVKTLQRSERTETHDERFRREARLAATISHRNVVRIFDLVDEPDGTLGLVMELLRGGTLESCMRERGAMSTLHTIAVAAPILSALNHVHQKGIVHRDVKPANVFFAVEPDGHVIPKVLDFGIAKLPTASSPLTVDGSVLGTPHYMSPEQIRGAEDLDGRSDMFSFAVVLYELLTGERLFQRDSAAASLAAVLEHEVDTDPRIEPRVWVAISRALAKRPYERFATCAEFAEALRSAVDASDEDLALALQELRPRSDSVPESDVFKVGGIASSASSSRSRSKPTSRNRSIVWTLAAAGGAAVLAVTVTLAITRSGGGAARADELGSAGAVAASSSAMPHALSPAGVTADRATATPPPSTAASPGAPDHGEAAPTPAPRVTATPLATKGSAPGATTRSPGARPLPPPMSKNAGKPPAKPIATSPGF